MSLLNTKPFKNAVATNEGWVDPNTKIVIVPIPSLKSRLLAGEDKDISVQEERPVVSSFLSSIFSNDKPIEQEIKIIEEVSIKEETVAEMETVVSKKTTVVLPPRRRKRK